MTTNPYAHLRARVRALLHTEAKMGPEERELHSWIVRSDFAGTHCTVIKGGANTLFVQHGEQRSGPFFPVRVLAILDELAGQPYPVYATQARTYVRLQRALAEPPKDGARILGVAVDGKRTVAYVGRANAAGKLAWIKR